MPSGIVPSFKLLPQKNVHTHTTHTHKHTHLHTRTQPDRHRRTHTLSHTHARTQRRIRRRCCARSRRPCRAFCGDGAEVRIGRSANQPQGESALVGNVQAASGPGYAAECVRGKEGKAGKAAAPTTRAAAALNRPRVLRRLPRPAASTAQRGQVRAAAKHTRVLYVLARGTGSTHTCGERRGARGIHRLGRRRRRCWRTCSLASGRPRR